MRENLSPMEAAVAHICTDLEKRYCNADGELVYDWNIPGVKPFRLTPFLLREWSMSIVCSILSDIHYNTDGNGSMLAGAQLRSLRTLSCLTRRVSDVRSPNRPLPKEAKHHQGLTLARSRRSSLLWQGL